MITSAPGTETDGQTVGVLPSLRRFLLGLLLFGSGGTLLELSLMGHVEDPWQVVPLVILSVTILLTLVLLRRTEHLPTRRVFRIVMVLSMLSGLVGTVLHYRGSMEFKLETDPTLHGFELFSKVVTSTAPPALAPGNMILLGLIGLAALYRLDLRTSSRNSS